MIPLQLEGGGLPATAVHDTVRAIVRQSIYQRSLRTSLLQRLVRWINELFDALPDIPHARQVAAACVIAVALLVVLRVLYAGRLRDREVLASARRQPGGAATIDAAADARRLAAAGQFAEAAHALYRALLQLVARREQLRLHPSKTSGDYARELRARRSSLYAPFSTFGRRYDRLLFGSDHVGAGDYAALLDDAQPLLEERAS